MTTALVLAAGLGQRLRGVTTGPKWLVPVGPLAPVDQQLRACIESDSISRVVVITSADDEAIRGEVMQYEAQIPIELVPNPDAHRWNNWSSALIGFEHIGTGSDIVLINSDVFAAVSWFDHGIEHLVAATTPALLIDTAKPLTDEAMKVGLSDGALRTIGKVGIADPIGEYVGLAWWPAGSATGLTARLARYRTDPAAEQNWYEHGIGEDMADDTPYRLVETLSSEWVEIDEPADVATAKTIAV